MKKGAVRRKLKKYFVPHEENDFKPHLLRWRTVGFVCVLMLVAEVAFLVGPLYLGTRSKLFGIILTNALIDGTNQNRVADNLPALMENPLLDAAAQEKANDMAKNNYFAHTSPAGLTPWYWFQQVGYNFTYAGENLAVNFTDSQDVVDAWMNSPEHRANILNPNYTDIGMATATGTFQGEPAIYVVEEFGTPAPVAAPSTFVNTAAAATTPAPVSAPTAQPTTTSKPVATKPVSKPVVVSAPVAAIPVVVASSTSQDSSSQQSFIAVQNVAPEGSAGTTTQAVSASVVGDNNAVPQSNIVQAAVASPRQLANDFYLFLISLFAVALFVNIFIKIRIQHPQLIFNGVFVVAIAVMCVVLNQHAFLSHALIF